MMSHKIMMLMGLLIVMLLSVSAWMMRPADRPWELWQFRGEPRGSGFLTWWEHDARDAFSTGAACLARMTQLTTGYASCINNGRTNHDQDVRRLADVMVFRLSEGTIEALWPGR
jgi:hypothetical protein